MKKSLEKHYLVSQSIYTLVSNPDVSDESIYVLYEFLTDFLSEFESAAYGRIRRHLQEKKMQEEYPHNELN
jgi:hypothetical protein